MTASLQLNDSTRCPVSSTATALRLREGGRAARVRVSITSRFDRQRCSGALRSGTEDSVRYVVKRPDHSVFQTGEMFSPFSKQLGVSTRVANHLGVQLRFSNEIVCGQRDIATDITLRRSGASETAHASGSHADPTTLPPTKVTKGPAPPLRRSRLRRALSGSQMSNPIREALMGRAVRTERKIADSDEGFCSSIERYSRLGVVSPAEKTHLFVNTVTIDLGATYDQHQHLPMDDVQLLKAVLYSPVPIQYPNSTESESSKLAARIAGSEDHHCRNLNTRYRRNTKEQPPQSWRQRHCQLCPTPTR